MQLFMPFQRNHHIIPISPVEYDISRKSQACHDCSRPFFPLELMICHQVSWLRILVIFSVWCIPLPLKLGVKLTAEICIGFNLYHSHMFLFWGNMFIVRMWKFWWETIEVHHLSSIYIMLKNPVLQMLFELYLLELDWGLLTYIPCRVNLFWKEFLFWRRIYLQWRRKRSAKLASQ